MPHWPRSLKLRASVTAILAAMFGIARQAHATDLVSSATGYTLSAAGNPYTVVSGAVIDTRGNGQTAITGSGWTLTNLGSVYGGHFAVEFDQPATVDNHGLFYSSTTSALALFGGAGVTNRAGATIAGHLDGVFAPGATSSVVNAGLIAGDINDMSVGQTAVHLPDGGTVTNLASGQHPLV